MARPITFRVWFDGKLVDERTVEEASIKIGSAGTSHVRLDHPSVSRVHCVIEVGTELSIMDLGSDAGTFVNSAPVTRAPIASGDQLRIGAYVLDVIAAEMTNLLGLPVRAKAPPDPVAAPDLKLRAPSLFDVASSDAVGLPPPAAASVELPPPPERPTVELHESDLLELDAELGRRHDTNK